MATLRQAKGYEEDVKWTRVAAPDQALVFAAGPAQRLLPLTSDRPKGMLLVGGKPLLQGAVESLAAHGVDDVVMVVGRHGEKIQSFFQDGGGFGLRIRYVHQATPDGTMAAVRLALPELDLDKPAFLMPGHAHITPALLKPLAAADRTALLVATAGQAHIQGVPMVRGNRLVGMQHAAPTVGSTRVSTNVLHAGPELLRALAATALDRHGELDVALGAWAAEGNPVQVVEADHPWRVVVEPWDLLRLNEAALDQMPREAKGKGIRGAVHIGTDTVVAPSAVLVGPLTIGDGCTIGEHAVVGPYVSIRNATVVGSHCEVRRSILNNNVLLDSHSVLRGGILDDGARIGPGFLCEEDATPAGPRGCIVGRDATLRARTTLPGGTLLDPETRI